MKKVMAILVVISLMLPVLAFAAEQTEWSVGGLIDKTKVYGADEAHGYIFRIDVKRPNGKVKKIYLKKDTVIEDTNGQKIGTDALKVGKSVTVSYQKDGDNFVAYKIVRGK
jgi:hypothetical protein